MKISDWIGAFRLRTLPLALSSIFMGNFLAKWAGGFSWAVCGLSISTTICLQILSNLANDYGDSIHGADSDERQGPSRAVQTGAISPLAMKKAMITFAMLSLVSGIGLLLVAFPGQTLQILVFLALGLLAIYAAINYTAGNNPYGYMGLGDISVLIFFGLVAVCGTYFLQTGEFNYFILLPALSCGFLATGVLNINNIRDIDSDLKAGKMSIPVRIGRGNAVTYHQILLVLAMGCAGLFVYLNFESNWQLLFVVSLPLFFLNAKAVKTKIIASELDPFLKQLALSTLLFVILFGFGLLIQN